MYFDPVEAGKRIKAIREAKGMTQMGFAEKLNISRSYMNKIEKGTKTASIDRNCSVRWGDFRLSHSWTKPCRCSGKRKYSDDA